MSSSLIDEVLSMDVVDVLDGIMEDVVVADVADVADGADVAAVADGADGADVAAVADVADGADVAAAVADVADGADGADVADIADVVSNEKNFKKKMLFLNQRIEWIKARNSHIQTNLETIMSGSVRDVAPAVDSIRWASEDIGNYSMQMEEISGYVENAVKSIIAENDNSSSLVFLQGADMDQTFSADAAEDVWKIEKVA